VALFVAQLVMSAAAVVFAAVMVVRAGLNCTEAADCDTERVHRFDHQTHTEVAILGGGIVVALLVAGIGTLVAAKRRSSRWIWPALGLGVVIVTYGISASMWLDTLSSGR